MKVSRRRFLLGASTLAICVANPALAGLHFHGSSLSGFNGGRSQVQSWDMGLTNETPFLNLMKTATEWNYNDNQGKPTPDQLDANGYPATIVHGGFKCITNIFPASSGRTGNYVITWDGNGSIELGVPNSGSITTVSGSKTGSGGFGRYVFTTTSPDALVVVITGLPLSNLKLFYGADETLLNAGQIFGVQYLSVLRSGNPGVMRFLDWSAGNGTNVTTWATRKPVSYISYFQDEYRSSIYTGTTTVLGVKHSATLGSGGPIDKQTLHVMFKVTPISVSIGANATVTWGAGSPVAHGMNIGQSFKFLAPSGTALPSPIVASTTDPNNQTIYWVTSVPTSSTFTFSASKGGANVNTTGGTLTGVPTAFALPSVQTVALSGATITWANHGLNIGDPVSVKSSVSLGLPTPYLGIQPFWVIASGFTANSFQISTTPGGSAISYPPVNITGFTSNFNQPILTIPGNSFAIGGFITIAGVGGLTGINGTWQIISVIGDSVKVQVSGSVTGTYTSGGTATPIVQGTITASGVTTFNINGSGDVPILVSGGTPDLTDNAAPFGGQTGTLIYDATFAGWLMFGGTVIGPAGLINRVPPEIMVELCKQIGAHPHFCAPPLSVDNMTDWHTQLATYVKNSGPSWMKPRFEGPNECWNFLFYSTGTAIVKPALLWGPSYFAQPNNWYGKVLSTIGQDISAVFGGDTTKYSVLCGVQTVQAGASDQDPRLTSALYVAQSAPAQSGYTKTAAFTYATHVCPANYWSPGARDTAQEVTWANDYAAAAGNPTAQAAIADSYIGTANDHGGSNSPFNLFSQNGYCVVWKAWAAGFGVMKMCGYEGGYSPDYGGNATINALRKAGKTSSLMQGYTTQLYNDFFAAGGEFPSCYMLSGAGAIWSVWDPDIYVTPTPPQWAAIAAFNH